MEEDIEGSHSRRNMLSIILLVVALGAFVYFALSQRPKQIYTSPSTQLIVVTEPAGTPLVLGDSSVMTINSITSKSVVLNGNYSNGQSNVSTWFEYGTDPNLNLNVNKTTPVHQLKKSNNFSETISNLNPDADLFYRAVGGNGTDPIVYGKILSIRTKADTTGQAPIVQTSMHSDIWQCDGNISGKDNICLVGEFIANGLPTKAWFEYGTTKALGKSTPQRNVGTDAGEFKEQTYFNPNLPYYVRIVAKNLSGTTRGEIVEYNVTVTK